MSTLLRAAATTEDVQAYRNAPLFAVSLPKFVVMSVCTLGLYEFYWCYRHWQAERRREEENLSPFWRTVFAPVWVFALLPRIQSLTTKHGVPATWSATGLALAFLLLNAAWRLPDPVWLVCLLTCLPLIPVQQSVNRLNATLVPEAGRNDRFSGLNVLFIVIGTILLLLLLLSLLFPESQNAQSPQHVAA